MDKKKWYQSKTIWGAAITIASLVLTQLGYTVSAEDQASVIDYIVNTAGYVGGVVAIYGRIKASKQIGQ